MQLWDSLFIVRRRMPSFWPVTASIAQESRVKSQEQGRHSRSGLPYLIACRSPSKSITSPTQKTSHGTGGLAGKAGLAGQDAISKWAGNRAAAQSGGASPVPSHVGRLETPGPLRTHRPPSQPHYTTGL